MAFSLLGCQVRGGRRNHQGNQAVGARSGPTPVWTVVLILTIAIGIASNASVDGFVRGLVDAGVRWPAIAKPPTASRESAGCCGSRRSRCSRSRARTSRRSCWRAPRRATRETAVRVAIGAGRKQLVRQVLADSLVIAIAGAAAGAILAFWIARIVPAFLFDEDAQKMIFAADPARRRARSPSRARRSRSCADCCR